MPQTPRAGTQERIETMGIFIKFLFGFARVGSVFIIVNMILKPSDNLPNWALFMAIIGFSFVFMDLE